VPKQVLSLTVEGMSCQHCVKAVSGAVKALPGVDSVVVSVENKSVVVGYNPEQTAPESIRVAIEGQGYTVA
jgi:copper ion binding protein